jgi:ubiquinone/menaquinone biosynthesis C-methylase UbiE
MTAEQVAHRVGAAADPLRRLLRALVALEVLSESDGLFSNAAMGELLRRDHPEALSDVAIARMRDPWWRAWGALPEAVRTGTSAYELANGRSMWADLHDDPDAAAAFNAMMASGTEEYATSLVESVDLSGAHRIVDVGGGTGQMLVALLQSTPAARGTLFDRPAGLIGADERLAAAGVGVRVDLVPGDFFESVPTGGDVYILRRVLHDWPDEDAVAILTSCRRAMGDGEARLLIAEVLMPEHPVPGPAEEEYAFTMDMHMFVMFGARERAVSEFGALLEAAGLRIDEVVATAPEGTIIAIPA